MDMPLSPAIDCNLGENRVYRYKKSSKGYILSINSWP